LNPRRHASELLKNPILGRGRRSGRRSLRSELLFNLAFLAAAALLLALWTASVLRFSLSAHPYALWLLALLVVTDALIFLSLGSYLIDRLVLHPLAETSAVAEAIVGGDYERRVPRGRTVEIDALARSLNRLTDQLLRNQAALAENVRSLDEANRLLHEAQRDLVQAEKMASLGRLAAGVAHEIGNPLGAVLGYTAVLRRRGAPDGDLLEGVEREARRIDRIVRGLLEYARPGPARRQPVDCNASIRRVVELLRGQGALGGVELRLNLTPDPTVIEGAPHRVDQIFVNLITNAVAAMQGGGRLALVTRRERYTPERTLPVRRADDPPGVNYAHLRRMRHGASRDANRLQENHEVVHVVVADTGAGIPSEHIGAIFDPFFSTKPPGEGTGLGLAIVAGTVAELGGRIEVSSAMDGGTTFHLFLPVARNSS
jgi:two-component system NtrC family sensor kinase